MTLKAFKKELFYLKKAFFEYHQGFKYVKNRYFLAKKILKVKKSFEKPINNQDLSVHVLTGHRDLVMLVWALASYYLVSQAIGQLYIHSDGTLDKGDKKIIKKFFPSAQVVEPAEFLEKFDSELMNYPLVKKYRTQYPQFFLLKKLLDPYFYSTKRLRLIIDSDLIWFSEPKLIDQQISNYSNPLMMQGVLAGEGNFVWFKDGSRLDQDLANYNSGIVLYSVGSFNLRKMVEYFDRINDEVKQNQHFIEQAGYAYCLTNVEGLPQEQYQIKGGYSDKTVVKHYTAPRRLTFYTEGLEIIKDKFLK